ncbi:facilitated trehalose transporter Tret1-like isoform X1 [Cloeon dipterum]|uniref:facilitated trehalose transporter Tret1-like isoform X1 n=2 Tax=Cloeon dipterum TaxID=197152 RepID=UPI0032203DF1
MVQQVEVEVTGPNDYSKNSYKAVIAQILVVSMALVLATANGMTSGLPALLLPQLQAKNSSIPTTEEDGSWIASIHSIFTPIGALISGPIMERLGRRTALIISIFPGLIGWICIAHSESHLALLIGRSFTGLSTGLSLAPGVVIIGESAEPRLRGILVGAPSISFSLGILMIYTLNSALPWQTVSLLATVLPLVALVSLFFLPESPLWLERVGRTEEAQKAMTWLRGGSEHQARHELLLLKQQKIQNVLFEEAHPTARKSSPLLSRPVLRALIVINVFNIFLVLGGTYTIIFYAVNVLQQSSGDSISAFEIAVGTAIARVLLTTLACFLLLHVGRRPLTISSGLGSSVAALGVSAWLYWSPKLGGYEWVPTALVLAFVVFNSYGFFTIQALMLGEMLPARARGPSSGLTCALINAVIFFTSKTYPWMSRVFQPHGLFLMFGTMSLAATLVVYLFMPETKGRTLAEIEEFFSGPSLLWRNYLLNGRRESATDF